MLKDAYFKTYVLYFGIVFVAIMFYMGLAINPTNNETLIGKYVDVIFCAGIIVTGLLFRVSGAHPHGILAIGAIGSFFVLTLGQDVVIRYLTLSALLFSIGMYGMVRSRNAVRVLMAIELMINAVNINLITFARFVDPVAVKGQLFAIFTLTVAAAEAAVGLAIVLAIYRSLSTVDMNKFNLLKW